MWTHKCPVFLVRRYKGMVAAYLARPFFVSVGPIARADTMNAVVRVVANTLETRLEFGRPTCL